MSNTRCLLRQPVATPGSLRSPCLLHTLCTGSYLDAHKTAHWFQQLLQSRLTMLRCVQACQIRLHSASGCSLLVNIVFSVRQGNLAVFWTDGLPGPLDDDVRRCWSSAR